ncbi:uncharacterized protein [Physcomitrium patens]|uniref:Bifunctional inhibitor/plant lipid transfer protein/seed storage helical domain-containing protein n=1 Tax=Physcomitrium patens TaxID=3218 RepID=A0A2K1L0G3_PHYPA|nr:non-specific lipid transfer protein GPI-anchored 1-like [Physcomitrium patens]PNR59515.1 hypothetical protein PHYPA_002306 [Physcomitrium patens]|eukprot:XP_024357515.1 non-specific lipid transfer protein GPI-anchored 1-like [Physcomitrella patens]
MAIISDLTRSIVAVAIALIWCTATASAETDCSTQFNNLAPCFDFVNNNAVKAPSTQCCSAFKTTEAKFPVCLCQLQQTFNDPATAPGNPVRANQIPSACGVAVDPSRCPGLLGLPPTPTPVQAPVATPPTVPPTSAGPSGMNVDCSNEFSELSSCFEYVASNVTKPTAACCSTLSEVHLNRPVCLCQILKEVNSGDPATAGLNVTKGLELPAACKVDANVNSCPALLGEPISSPSPSAESPKSTADTTSGQKAGSPADSVATPDASTTGPDGSGGFILPASSGARLLQSLALVTALHLIF